MSVIVDLDNDCPGHWIPELEKMQNWLSLINQALHPGTGVVSVGVRVVDSKSSALLNARYRGKNSPTNVLSFSCELPEPVVRELEIRPLGDLAVCAPVLEMEASQQGKSLDAHWAHLLAHGYLHLNGYRHETAAEAEEMEALEITLLESLGFSNPYIVN